MNRSYKYRLWPTAIQADRLESWLELCRELYNAALQHRKDAWEKGVRIGYYDQQYALAEVREVRPEFKAVPVWVLRGVLQRLDSAYRGFFRRCKSGQKPGYPRFKDRRRFQSILINDINNSGRVIGKQVTLPKLGRINFKYHRPIEGTPKTIALTKDARGNWHISFACIGVPVKPQPVTGQDVGIDLGLQTFVATSDGELFANPEHLKSVERLLKRSQRALARKKRGSRRRQKCARLLARRHEKLAAVRREYHIGVAKTLVKKYDIVYVEDLNIQGLAKGQLAKSVHDAGWSSFLKWLNVKAEEAGRRVIAVNPAGTSQICSRCGCTVKKDLSVRIHVCPNCGLRLDRDINAAKNILGLGRGLRREALVVNRLQRPEKELL